VGAIATAAAIAPMAALPLETLEVPASPSFEQGGCSALALLESRFAHAAQVEADRSSGRKARQEHLKTLGIDYHVRTLKRQLAGSVSSVPPEVQAAMRHILLRVTELRTDLDIEKALGAAGLWVAPEERRPGYLSTERTVPLVELWLLLNPTRSRRSLAALLSERLAHRGAHLKIDSLQDILAGRQPLARREVHEDRARPSVDAGGCIRTRGQRSLAAASGGHRRLPSGSGPRTC